MRLDRLGLLLLAGTTACVSEPSSNGEPLLCDDNRQCEERFGDGWRCLSGGCVLNEAPRIDGFALVDGASLSSGPFFVRQPMSVTLRVEGSDTDGDSVAFTWFQDEEGRPIPDRGPASNQTGDTITLESTTPGEPLSLGSYRYRVTPFDGRVEGAPQTVVVTVEAPGDVVYVSQLTGDDGETCGTIDRPCRTLEQALAVAPTATIQLAAAASPYRSCLGQGATDTVPFDLEGCFDPQTWEPISSRRRECEIQCTPVLIPADDPVFAVGHIWPGSTRARDVTFTLDPEGPIDDATIATTVLAEPAADLSVDVEATNVDVIAPGCGDDCLSVGISARDVEVAFSGINVVADAREFSPVFSFIGVLVERSSGTIRGDLVDTAIPLDADEREALISNVRGRVSLNAPASADAVGVAANAFSGEIRGVAVTGGIGLGIAGFRIQGGTPLLEDNVVDILGFSTRAVSGFSLSDCPVGDECAISDANDPEGWVKATLRNNAVYLAGASDIDLSSPCIGVGFEIDSRSARQTVESNHISIGSEFSLAVGGALVLAEQPASSGERATVRSNRIQVAGGNRDEFCVFFNAGLGLPFNAGLLGLQATGSTHAALTANHIALGSLTSTIDGYRAGENLTASGIFVGNAEDSAEPLEVSRNEVLIGEGPSESYALTSDTSQVRIENNLLYGGDTPRSGGLLILAQENDGSSRNVTETSLPLVRYNTIHGGGVLGRTASSRGLQLQIAPGQTPLNALTRIGTFAGNLIDAGQGLGRRHILDNAINTAGPIFPNPTTTPPSDFGQLLDPPARAQPLAATVSYDTRGEIWRVVTAAGEVLSFQEKGTPARLQLVGDSPVPLQAPVYDIQELGGSSVIYAAGTSGFGFTRIDASDGEAIDAFETFRPDPVPVTRIVDLTTRELGGSQQAVILAETASGRLLFEADAATGYSPWVPIDVTDAPDLMALTRAPDGNVYALGPDPMSAGEFVVYRVGRDQPPTRAFNLIGFSEPVGLLFLGREVSFESALFDLAVWGANGLDVFSSVPNSATPLCASGASLGGCAQIPIPRVPSNGACDGDGPTSVIEASGVSNQQILLVGCSSGAIELHVLTTSLSFQAGADVMDGVNPIDSPVTYLAQLPANARRTSKVLAILGEAGVVAIFDLNDEATVIAPGPISNNFANVAARIDGGEPVSTLAEVGDLSIVAPASPCQLVASPSEEAETVRDLRLTGGACVNADTLTLPPLEADVDGQARDCEPDVGAYELTSSPGACP